MLDCEGGIREKRVPVPETLVDGLQLINQLHKKIVNNREGIFESMPYS